MNAHTVTGWASPRGVAALELLELVRRERRLTRAAAARRLGLGSSSATEIAAQLRDLRLIAEYSAPSSRTGAANIHVAAPS